MSLSARRAWIEIMYPLSPPPAARVALRKESVDRNRDDYGRVYHVAIVALRKESVDRNKHTQPAEQVKTRRSPQGERG